MENLNISKEEQDLIRQFADSLLDLKEGKFKRLF